MSYLVCYCKREIICTVNYKTGAENAEDYHGRHYIVGDKFKNAVLCEKPVLIVVNCVAEHRPEKNNHYSAKFNPNLFDVKLNYTKRKVKHTPVKEQTVEHKGLEDDVREGGLTAKRRAGIAHPHKRGGNRENYYGRLDFLEFSVELSKSRAYAHKGAYVEGKLVDADAVVAVGEWHNKEVCDVKPDSDACKDAEQLVFCLVALAVEYYR